MKNHFKSWFFFLCVISSSVMADQPVFCPGISCAKVWAMSDEYQATPMPNNHGQAWIQLDGSSYQYDGKNGTLTINYKHDVNGPEKTAYIKFDLFSTHQDLQDHGYLTANIMITSPMPPAQIVGRIWPAFWLVGPAWPTNGEIDIAEYMANNVTNVNLNGGYITGDATGKPVIHNISTYAFVSYNKPGLGDVGHSHTYVVEWQKVQTGTVDANAHTYQLTFYFDGQKIGSKLLSTTQYPDMAIIQGLDRNNLQIVFDADDIVSNNNPSIGNVESAPHLEYQMLVSNVAAYKVESSQ